MTHTTRRAYRLPITLLIIFSAIAIGSAVAAPALEGATEPGGGPANLTASTGATIKKAAILYTIDGRWGESFWAGTFMHNSRMTLRLDTELEPGEHTLELMYRLQPPVSLSFTAEAGTEYRIDEDAGEVVVRRASDGTIVGRAVSVATDPTAPPPQEGCRFVQPTRATTTEGKKLDVIVLKVDGRFGPHESYPYRYIFNGPKLKDGVDLLLEPGDHEIVLYGSDGKGHTPPGTVRFTCEAGRTYGLQLSLEDIEDKELRKIFSGLLTGEVVER